MDTRPGAYYATPMRRIPVLFAALLTVSCGGATATPPSSATPAATSPDATPPQAITALQYPDAQRGDVVDDYHGTVVADPYRWLEDTNATATGAWVKAQNEVTEGLLAAVPARKVLNKRLTKVWDHERFGIPTEEGGRYFFTKNDGLQNQAVLYWATALNAKPKVLIDPNTFREDGTAALGGWEVSRDGKKIAYAVRQGGSDWSTWHVRDVASGADETDELKWVKFSGISWDADNKGFYYARYPEPKTKSQLTGINYYQKLYYHTLGAAQADDKLIYENKKEKKWGFGGRVTEDGRYLIVSVRMGTDDKNLVYFRDLKARGKRAAFRPLFTKWDADWSFVDNDGSLFWFFTNKDAPRGRLVAVETGRRARGKVTPVELIAQAPETLRSVRVVGDRLFANYLKDAYTMIRIFDLKGKPMGDVELPGIGTGGGFGGKRKDRETFYRYTSFTDVSTIYRYDISSRTSTVFRQPKVDFDASKYVTKQVRYKSVDGTSIPMFIVHKKGLKLDGNNPTYLYGYGGFNISLTPYFSAARTVWLDMGGVYVVPSLRGGGEYGEEWHEAGTKLRKQNVFDDFIAAAEWLIENRYTRPEKLAISGGSNGGLLVGAVMTQRPDLFGAAVPKVGVMDMLRFHKFTIGWAWTDDYGSSDDPAEFKALHAYSPYHNIKEGTAYPATMVMTGDHDDRVVPGHSFKFAAQLQHAHKGDAPVVIRIETRAGHGAGTPTKMRIDAAADEYAFLVKTLGMNPE